jgi:uncharacterized protein
LKLADGNLLIAMKHQEHVLHSRAQKFFVDNPKVATCAISELNLIRVLMATGYTPRDADSLLADFISMHRAKLIPCDLSARGIAEKSGGHKQTTDTYLAMLAEKHGMKLATFDENLAARFPKIAELV